MVVVGGGWGRHVIYCLSDSTVHCFSYANDALCLAEEIAINQLTIGQLKGKKNRVKEREKAPVPSLLVLLFFSSTTSWTWGSLQSLATGSVSGSGLQVEGRRRMWGNEK